MEFDEIFDKYKELKKKDPAGAMSFLLNNIDKSPMAAGSCFPAMMINEKDAVAIADGSFYEFTPLTDLRPRLKRGRTYLFKGGSYIEEDPQRMLRQGKEPLSRVLNIPGTEYLLKAQKIIPESSIGTSMEHYHSDIVESVNSLRKLVLKKY